MDFFPEDVSMLRLVQSQGRISHRFASDQQSPALHEQLHTRILGANDPSELKCKLLANRGISVAAGRWMAQTGPVCPFSSIAIEAVVLNFAWPGSFPCIPPRFL
ncbi:hypothetical protein D3C81_636160 [compost metagenome]